MGVINNYSQTVHKVIAKLIFRSWTLTIYKIELNPRPIINPNKRLINIFLYIESSITNLIRSYRIFFFYIIHVSCLDFEKQFKLHKKFFDNLTISIIKYFKFSLKS